MPSIKPTPFTTEMYADSRYKPLGWSRYIFIAGTALFIFAIQYAYINMVSPVFYYLGNEYHRPALATWVLFSGAALVPSLWMPLRLQRPSEFFYLWLYIVVYIPVCFIPLLTVGQGNAAVTQCANLVLVMLGCMAMLGVIYIIPLIRVPKCQVNETVLMTGIVASLLVSYVVIYMAFEGRLSFASSADVGKVRIEGRETLESSNWGRLAGYCMTLSASCLNPFLMAYGLRSRSWKPFAFGAAGQVFAYSVNAVRGPIATVLLLIALYYAVRQRRWQFGPACIWGCAGIVVACALISSVAGENTRVEIAWGLLRNFITHASVTHKYVTFFSESPHTNFTHIRGLGWVAENPYQGTTIGRVIGSAVDGRADNNANGNIWADGFASYGFVGMIIVTIIAACLFYFVDCALRNNDRIFAVLAISAHALNLADVSIFTTFLSGGLGLSVVLAYLGQTLCMPAAASEEPVEKVTRPKSSASPSRRMRVRSR